MRNSLFFATILILTLTIVIVEPTHAGDKPAANANEGTAAKSAQAAAPRTEDYGQTPDAAGKTQSTTASAEKTDAAAKKAIKSDTNTSSPDPNRRWIIRQRNYAGAKATPAKRKPLQWDGKSQQTQCAKYEHQLSAHFDQARYYSIQGDRCKTARYAHEFIEAAAICQSACPKDFLEYNGFSDEVLRNMHQLEALGTESCLGKSAVTNQAAPAGANPPAAERNAGQNPTAQKHAE